MKRKTATKHKSFRATKKAENLTDMTSETDVNGSYTGTPEAEGELPIQDVDDL